jgi:hypothetical protein
MRLPFRTALLSLGLFALLHAATADTVGGADAKVLSAEPPLATVVVQAVELEPRLTFLSPGQNEEWLEGGTATIQWLSVGPIKTVTLYYYGDVTKLGGEDRGDFSAIIADHAPNQGLYRWTVPWVDARSFMLRLAGYDAAGKLLAETERPVRFRAAELAGLNGTFIAVSKKRQRLWYYKDNELKWISIVSTAEEPYTTPDMHPGSYSSHGEMGRVFYKDPNAFSHEYQVPMLWWMAITSSGSHGIHATSPPFYDYLGEPASHGCIRQHRYDAHQLYEMVEVGTPVYVF